MSFDRYSHFRKRMQRYSFYPYTPNKSSLFFDLFYTTPYISFIFNTLPKPVSYRSMTAAPPCTHLFPEATDTILSTSSRPPGSSFFPSGDKDGIKKSLRLFSESEDLEKRRLPTLPLLRSTIGVTGLNFSVRNGKRWNPGAIATGNGGHIGQLVLQERSQIVFRF